MTSLTEPAAALAAAVDHLSAAQAANDALRDAYTHRPGYGTPDPKYVASMHQAINYGLKAAEVSALIAIAGDLVTVHTTPRDRVRAGVPGRSALEGRLSAVDPLEACDETPDCPASAHVFACPVPIVRGRV